MGDREFERELRPQGQPSPSQVTRAGKGMKLGPRSLEGCESDTVEAQSNSPLINTWTVVIQPSYSALRDLAAGEPWAVTMNIYMNHDSANSIILYRDLFNPTPLPVLLIGQAFGVHGQQVRVGVTRSDPDMSKVLEIEVAIIPGAPGEGTIIKGPYQIGGLSSSVLVNIPTMSRHVTLIGALSAGDQLQWIGANGVNIVGTIDMSDPLLGVPLPIVPDAAYLKFVTTSGSPKQVIFDFETWE